MAGVCQNGGVHLPPEIYPPRGRGRSLLHVSAILAIVAALLTFAPSPAWVMFALSGLLIVSIDISHTRIPVLLGASVSGCVFIVAWLDTLGVAHWALVVAAVLLTVAGTIWCIPLLLARSPLGSRTVLLVALVILLVLAVMVATSPSEHMVTLSWAALWCLSVHAILFLLSVVGAGDVLWGFGCGAVVADAVALAPSADHAPVVAAFLGVVIYYVLLTPFLLLSAWYFRGWRPHFGIYAERAAKMSRQSADSQHYEVPLAPASYLAVLAASTIVQTGWLPVG